MNRVRAFALLLVVLGVKAVAGAQPGSEPKKGTPTQAQTLAKSPTLGDFDHKLGSRPISLEEAVGVALSLNPALAAAGANLAYAQARIGEVQSGFMPTVSIGSGGEFVSHLVTPVYVVQATLPLDISHLVATATDQARFQEIAARLDINRIRNETVYRVTNGFYSALRAQALVEVADENLANSQERLRDAQARYKARAVAYIDVVRAETDVADAQRQVIQSRSSVTATLGQLAGAMGIDPAHPPQILDQGAVVLPPGITLPTNVSIPTPDQMPVTPPAQNSARAVSPLSGGIQARPTDLGTDFETALSDALKARPEILESDAELSAAERGVYLARRSDLPSLTLGLGYFDLRTQSGSRVNESQAYLGINIPLYDGGLGKARVQEARSTVAAAVTAHRQAIDAVTLDVQQAFVALEQARDQVTASVQGVVQARVAYDLAKVRYDTGVASHAGISPLLELSDAQAALTLAEQNQVNALYDYNNARAQVDRSVGRFAYVDNAPGFKRPPAESEVGRPGR